MKALQSLSLLIRQMRPSHSHSFLPVPFLFYHPPVTPLSVSQSNRILHPPQTRYNSTKTSSEEAPQNNTSTRSAEDTSTSEVPKPFAAIKPGDDSPLLPHEALDRRHPTPPQPKGRFLLSETEPGYHLVFTCKPCGVRSEHQISKQGYHNGTVLITCPGCKNRHVISDHLKIFFDLSTTIEDILRQKGETLKRGRINAAGDVEFLPDPSEVPSAGTLTDEDKITRLMNNIRTLNKQE